MKNRELLEEKIRGYLLYNVDIEENDINDLIEITIKTQIEDSNISRKPVYINDNIGKEEKLVSFFSEDREDDTDYIVAINGDAINDMIENITDKEQKKRVVFDTILESIKVSMQYTNREKNTIDEKLKGISNVMGNNTSKNLSLEEKDIAMQTLDDVIKSIIPKDNKVIQSDILDSLNSYNKDKRIIDIKEDIIDKYSVIEYLSESRKIKDVNEKFKYESKYLEKLKNQFKGLKRDFQKEGSIENLPIQEEDSKIKTAFRRITDNNIYNISKMADYNTFEDIARYEEISNEIDRSRQIIESRAEDVSIEDINNEKIKGIYKDLIKDKDRISNLDPETTINNYVFECVEDNELNNKILSYMGKYPNIYAALEKLEDSDLAELKKEFLFKDKSYEEFYKKMTRKSNHEYKKMDNIFKEYSEKWEEDIYLKYKEMSTIDKEELLRYSIIDEDDEIAKNILSSLERDKEEQYILAKEEDKKIKQTEKSISVKNIIDREYSLEGEFFKIEDYDQYAMKRESTVFDTNKAIIEKIQEFYSGNKKLSNIFSKYTSSSDVSNSLNNIEHDDLMSIRDTAKEKNKDLIGSIKYINRRSVEPVEYELKKCGKGVLNLLNYGTDEELSIKLEEIKDDDMKKELFHMARYVSYKEAEQENENILLLEKNIDKVSKSDEDKNYISNILYLSKQKNILKKEAVDWNLTEKAVLNDIEIKENENSIGVGGLLDRIDSISKLELDRNKEKSKSQNTLSNRLGKKLDELKEKIMDVTSVDRSNGYNKKDEGLSYS